MTESEAIRVSPRKLKLWTARAFLALGCPPRAAARAADALHYADLAGIDSHGVANLERVYATAIRSGRVRPSAKPRLVIDLGAAAVFDARRGLGPVAGAVAMRWAIAAAVRSGVGLAAVRNSSHFGAAGYYTALAVKNNMIGLAMTNLGGQGIAPPPGGSVPLLGTNPLAAAAPAGSLPPFALDMSTTAAATGKIRQAARQGRAIPEGWLADRDGRPITDPAAFDRGDAVLQFAGGHKGYGLAVLVDVLCGVLAGAAVGPTPAALRGAQVDTNVGHLFVAINAPALRPDGFREQMDSLLGTLLACPAANSAAPVSYAGFAESGTRSERLRDGIPLSTPVFDSLNRLADELGLPALKPLSTPQEGRTK